MKCQCGKEKGMFTYLDDRITNLIGVILVGIVIGIGVYAIWFMNA